MDLTIRFKETHKNSMTNPGGTNIKLDNKIVAKVMSKMDTSMPVIKFFEGPNKGRVFEIDSKEFLQVFKKMMKNKV